MQVKTQPMNKLTAKENKIAYFIQSDIPVALRPFQDIAAKCGIAESEIIRITEKLRQEGFIRKFGAVLRHHQAGYSQNALVVWSVPQETIEITGMQLASCDFISHCYERKPAFLSKYNLFTMLHARDISINILVDKASAATGISDFLILESLEEYKKISPEYFS